MSEQKNGGPAFPQDHRDKDGIGSQYFGMTLRDYFAAKAAQGIMASLKMSDDCTPRDVALDSYDVADAMLKARG